MYTSKLSNIILIYFDLLFQMDSNSFLKVVLSLSGGSGFGFMNVLNITTDTLKQNKNSEGDRKIII